MFINTYKEFSVNEKVSVKKQVLFDFILTTHDSGFYQTAPVMEYAFNISNILTIAEIEFDSNLLLPASFSFTECSGILFYGQFIKSFPAFYIFGSDYFKG